MVNRKYTPIAYALYALRIALMGIPALMSQARDLVRCQDLVLWCNLPTQSSLPSIPLHQVLYQLEDGEQTWPEAPSLEEG
jgi:hypothetical protein